MRLRLGSMCSGYEGLGMAIADVLDVELAWVADNSPGAAAILAHHYPNVPNLGDITAVDWASVKPVDVLAAGFPCQDVSSAGLRAGMREGNRSGLWAHVALAIAALRPSIVILENVRGLLSARADSDLEPCAGCVGDDSEQFVVRALGVVLGDLADLGFDAEWRTLPASSIGAPHPRERVFVLAWPRFVPSVARGVGRSDAAGDGRDERRTEPAGILRRPHAAVRCTAAPADAEDLRHQRGGYHGDGGPDLRTVVAGLAADTHEQPGEQRRLAASGQAPGGGAFGPTPRRDREPVDALLPTLAARDWKPCDSNLLGTNARPLNEVIVSGVAREAAKGDTTNWGDYEPAIRRWEALTRPVPSPTEPGKTGKPRLAPAFSEWMMGLPAGWVTAVPGLTRNQQLTAIGNGVVPAQAAHALRLLLAAMRAEVAA